MKEKFLDEQQRRDAEMQNQYLDVVRYQKIDVH